MVVFVIWSCSQNSNTDKNKFQSNRSNIVNVHDKVIEIVFHEDEVLISGSNRLYPVDNTLIIVDHKSTDKLLHFFDLNGLKYLTSFASRGKGPKELVNPGYLATDESNRRFYVSDNGKMIIYGYSLDSIFNNTFYKQEVKYKMNEGLFPIKYYYINDTLSISILLEPIGVSDFQNYLAKINFQTGTIKKINYDAPNLDYKLKKWLNIDVLETQNLCAISYYCVDLITLCNLNGEVKCNIFGPNYNKNGDGKKYFTKITFCNNVIIAAYSGIDWGEDDAPRQLVVFDIDGNYLKTLDTGYRIVDYCFDKKHNRLLLSLNDVEIQFAELKLDDLID
jgi:hypothetical protein